MLITTTIRYLDNLFFTQYNVWYTIKCMKYYQNYIYLLLQIIDLSLSYDNVFIVNCTKDLPMKYNNNYRISINDDMSDDAINIIYE